MQKKGHTLHFLSPKRQPFNFGTSKQVRVWRALVCWRVVLPIIGHIELQDESGGSRETIEHEVGPLLSGEHDVEVLSVGGESQRVGPERGRGQQDAEEQRETKEPHIGGYTKAPSRRLESVHIIHQQMGIQGS